MLSENQGPWPSMTTPPVLLPVQRPQPDGILSRRQLALCSPSSGGSTPAPTYPSDMVPTPHAALGELVMESTEALWFHSACTLRTAQF